MSQPTPGKWKVSDFKPTLIEADDGAGVAETIHRAWDESKANARLIAAAPELLEAATKMLYRIEHPTGNRETLDEAKALLRAAIAKAEGK